MEPDSTSQRVDAHRAFSLLVGSVICAALSFAGATSASGEAFPPPRPLGADLPAYHAPAEPAADPVATELRGVLSLPQALAAALRHNPTLAAFSWEVRARDAAALQAGLLPNPILETELEDFGGERSRRRFASAQTTIRVAQLIELGGKRGKRRRLALLERDLAGWDYEARRMDVFTEVTKAFVATVAVQERLSLADELLRVARESVDTVGATVRAGAVSPVEERRARVAVARAGIDRVQLERELAASRAVLASTLGASSVTFARLSGDLASISEPPPVNSLLGLVDQNPDVARWIAESEQREAALALERAERVPDVAVGPGIRRYNDDDTTGFVFELSIPLPVFNRNQGGVLEARYRLAQARSAGRAAEVAAHASLVAAHERLLGAFQRVRTLRDDVIPQAQQVYGGALDAYQRGLFRYLEVLDAQRTLFEVRGQYVEALAEYHRAAADVERLTGAPLDAMHLRGGESEK